jgi:hypothetical protein
MRKRNKNTITRISHNLLLAVAVFLTSLSYRLYFFKKQRDHFYLLVNLKGNSVKEV